MSAPCILIMAGGTGGHVFPALSLAELLRARGFHIVWLGTRAGIEARLVPQAGIEVEWIDIGGLRGKGVLTLVTAPLRLLRALWQALVVIRKHRPAVVVGLGGYVSGPGGLAAWLSRRPLVIHEQNAIAGLTNRLLARLADVVLEAFRDSFPVARRARTIGNPVRSAFFAIEAPRTRYAARHGAIRLLVVGGSQGAMRLNSLVPQAVALLKEKIDLSICHQSGARGLDATFAAYRDLGTHAQVLPFIDDIAAAYADADLVICRAGALTVSEIAAAGVAAIFVPFPAAVDDHQTRNALYLVAQGAAVMLSERGLTAAQLAEQLVALCKDRLILQSMAEKARALAEPRAALDLADCVVQAGGLTSEVPA